MTGKVESGKLILAANPFMRQNAEEMRITAEDNQMDTTNLDSNISKLENIVLFLLPRCKFAKFIEALASWTEGPILFSPLDGEELYTLLCVLKAPFSQKFKLGEGIELSVTGRANNLETLRKFITAVNCIHACTDHASPSLLKKNLDLVTDMQKTYAPQFSLNCKVLELLSRRHITREKFGPF